MDEDVLAGGEFDRASVPDVASGPDGLAPDFDVLGGGQGHASAGFVHGVEGLDGKGNGVKGAAVYGDVAGDDGDVSGRPGISGDAAALHDGEVAIGADGDALAVGADFAGRGDHHGMIAIVQDRAAGNRDQAADLDGAAADPAAIAHLERPGGRGSVAGQVPRVHGQGVLAIGADSAAADKVRAVELDRNWCNQVQVGHIRAGINRSVIALALDDAANDDLRLDLVNDDAGDGLLLVVARAVHALG